MEDTQLPPPASSTPMTPDLPFRVSGSAPPPPPPPSSTASAAASPQEPVKIIGSRRFPIKTLLFFILGISIIAVIAAAAWYIFSKTPSLGTQTLTYWGLWEPESVINPLISEYEAAHPKVKIKYIQQSPIEYRERLQAALSQGRGPDIMRIHNSWIPMFRADLSPVPASVYSTQDFVSTFYPVASTDLRLGNSYLAIPLEFDGLTMVVNDQLLQQSGHSIPQNWDDFRVAAQAMTRCDTPAGDCPAKSRVLISGAALGTADNIDHWQDILAVLMLQNKVNLNSPVGKPAEDVLAYYTSFVRFDHMWNSTLPSSTTQFAAGKLGFYFGPSWRIFEIQAKNPNLKFSVHPIPQLPIDPARNEKPITWASYWVEGVNKKSPQAQAAWEFLKFLSSKESLQKMYQNAVASGRAFGEPYGRKDMADSVQTAPIVGAYIYQAPTAQSWYMASHTYDGASGINSRLTSYFTTAIDYVTKGGSAQSAIKTLNAGISQVLVQYGLIVAPPPQK